MADEEKTQAPSTHKIAKAREEGNVSKSPELAGFFILLVGLGAMFLLLPFGWSIAKRFLSISIHLSHKKLMCECWGI